MLQGGKPYSIKTFEIKRLQLPTSTLASEAIQLRRLRLIPKFSPNWLRVWFLTLYDSHSETEKKHDCFQLKSGFLHILFECDTEQISKTYKKDVFWVRF